MFEAALLSRLAADTTLTGYLSTYGSAPAIFSEQAPEDVSINDTYITFYINKSDGGNPAVDSFIITLDVWAYTENRATGRAVVQRLDEVLDRAELMTSTRYHCIRLFRASGGPVLDTDPRSYHYNVQFEARAGRMAWAKNLSS